MTTTQPVSVIAVGGTYSFDGDVTPCDWYHPGSAWSTHMTTTHNVRPASTDRPFVWSSALDGFSFWGRRGVEWKAGAYGLISYVVSVERGGDDNGVGLCGEDTNIVAHSFGGLVALEAAARGLKIHTLVTVATPARADYFPVAERARPNITHWVHVMSSGVDLWGFLGAIGDRSFTLRRQTFPHCDLTIRIPQMGHTGILDTPTQFRWWHDAGLIGHLKG